MLSKITRKPESIMPTATLRLTVVAVLMLVAFCRAAAADTVILLNGDRFDGEVHDKKTLSLNPLSLKNITMSNARRAGATYEYITWEVRDVAMVIIEKTDAREVVDFTELRAQSFDGGEPDTLSDEAPATAEPLPAGSDGVPVAGTTTESEESSRRGPWLVDVSPQTAWVMTGAGATMLVLGLAVKFGEEEDPDGGEPKDTYNAANLVFIAGGIALTTLGITSLFRHAPDRSSPSVDVQHSRVNPGLSIDPAKRYLHLLWSW